MEQPLASREAVEAFREDSAGGIDRMVGARPRSYRVAVRLSHLALAVIDQERSRRLYGTYFGFDAGPATRYEDGVLIVRDRDGFDLALGEGEVGELPGFVHFGFRGSGPASVRALRDRLMADGVTFVEDEDTGAYVGFKCLDPDGYVVEVYWEAGGGASEPGRADVS